MIIFSQEIGEKNYAGLCTSSFALVKASLPLKIFCSVGQKKHSSFNFADVAQKNANQEGSGNNFAASNSPPVLVIVCLFSRACENSRALLRE